MNYLFRREFESASDAFLLRLRRAKFILEPLLVVPRLSVGLETKVGVKGPVQHDKPLVLRFVQHDETATLKPEGPHSSVTPQVGQGTHAELKAASRRRYATLTVGANQEEVRARHPC